MAGLTRGRFDAHFVSAEDCFFAALEERLREVLARAKEAEELGRTWAGGLYRAAEMICAEVAADRLFAGLCFGRVAEAAKARAASVERRERLLAEVTAHIREDAPAESYPGDLEVEASLEAACALLGAKAAGGGSAAGGSAPPVAATVAYLVLAPLIGPDATLATIREEVAAESGLSEGPWLETAS
jgi:AcrR family transcriptional regulator